MQARLDAIASALSGLPIHVTGLAVNTEKETLRAEMLRDCMLLFYSHPAVAERGAWRTMECVCWRILKWGIIVRI